MKGVKSEVKSGVKSGLKLLSSEATMLLKLNNSEQIERYLFIKGSNRGSNQGSNRGLNLLSSEATMLLKSDRPPQDRSLDYH